jgi:FeS assembly SUF system regulator
MLRISKLADYSTVIMVYLAKKPEKLSSARDIAMGTHIALPTVSKLLKRLTAASLLVSVRGTTGGYRLGKKAEDISVSEILHALDESRGLTECEQTPTACALHQVCHVQHHWRLISHIIESTLDSVSLANLISPQGIQRG